MASLYLVRHAPTKWNRADKEIVRSQLGIKPDKDALRAWLDHVGPLLGDKGIAFVASSDLPRGKESGRALAEWLGLPPQAAIATPWLNTWNSGDEHEGRPYDEVERSLRHFVEHPGETPEGGEPFSNVVGRLVTALGTLDAMVRHRDSSGVAILHGNQFMALPHVRNGEPLRYVPHGELPRPGATFEIRVS